MKIRGKRECQSCGESWSYYDTGSVACPGCGSLKSVGTDDTRTLHTDTPATLDLTPIVAQLAEDDVQIKECHEELSDRLREYTRKRGFIRGGELQELDEQYLGARELLHAVDIFTRQRDPSDRERLYILDLLRTVATGDRLADTEPPEALLGARGAGVADAVGAYHRDLRSWFDEYPYPEAERTLSALRDRVKRAEALNGAIESDEAKALVAVARSLGAAAREGQQESDKRLIHARDRLDELS